MANNLKILCTKLSKLRLDHIVTRSAVFTVKYRPPYWYQPKERVLSDEYLTQDNKKFIEEFINDRKNTQQELESPLVNGTFQISQQWNRSTRRVGLVARKIGNYPIWSKDGKKMQTTLLQVVDNHVIKYIPPEEFNPMKTTELKWREKRRLGCILVGSETIDPTTVTKDYTDLFSRVGMLPKKHLFRFMVSPEAALPTGTPLFASHFRVGDYIDVRAKTMDRGFQGVMKRWGFKGMPASHGVTKTHRRPGNIGAGGEKARVWPGTKMPGHMGNRWRTLRGVKILRINTKYNVIWTLGVAIPGETGAMCYLFDTVLPLRKLESSPPFPTYLPSNDELIEYYDECVHPFADRTLTFEET
ncbi:unnamed protein product [Diatraea saccharalis]|uniref:Large ribosomal subunit protein uL3m n=1 Tax=Diatraea saccharalis TaxID=40085 RepID=A0A9P0C324_9NEOP|nr:unnamed protein product [Diatraea saccharalis]